MRGNVQSHRRITLAGRQTIMRRILLPTILCAFALASCRHPMDSRTQLERERENQRKVDEAARKAGRAAYDITHDAAKQAEEAAKQLNRDIQSASDQAKKGWNDAKREHQDHPDKKQP
jgi:hypothetical protein